MAECLIGCDLKGLGRFQSGDDIPTGKLKKSTARWLVRRGVVAALDDEGDG